IDYEVNIGLKNSTNVKLKHGGNDGIISGKTHQGTITFVGVKVTLVNDFQDGSISACVINTDDRAAKTFDDTSSIWVIPD
ncbi:MAG: hypothetical protein JSV09_12175, partial [Thermoplasmata archaeon]